MRRQLELFPRPKRVADSGTRYGDERGLAEVADERPCHDCGVTKGQLHVPGCDVARCTRCGEQMIWCGGCPDLVDEPPLESPKLGMEPLERFLEARRRRER
jgi:hypothetical protein